MAVAKVRRPSYKDVLQPALQRRFIQTFCVLLGFAYVYAVALGSWNSFLWSWFPIGPAGIRTVFLLLSSLPVIFLRIAQYHVGLRTSDSGFQTFLHHALKVQTAEALFSYTFSSYFFSQIYLWSLPDTAGLEWITYFMNDRARLNEKTLFFTAHLVLLGVYQGLVHLFKDDDRLSLGVVRPQKGGGNAEGNNGDKYWKRFLDQLPMVIVTSINQSLAGLVLSAIIYPFFLRKTVWRTMLFFLRPVYNLPKTNLLPASMPFSLKSLGRSFVAGLLLTFAWTTVNVGFSLFLAKEPLKNEKPLSSDSKDPNGSLLNGLKSKKAPIKCFAMWELAFIARDYPDRRKAIYEDIDRADGPMWSQVYAICLEVLKSVETRIDSHGKPPEPEKSDTEKADEPKKRTTAPPKEGPIFQSTPPKPKFLVEVEKVVNQAATAPGQGSQISPLAKKTGAAAKQQLLKMQKEITGSDDPQGLLREFALRVLSSVAGWPFRQDYRRRLAKAVLGTPYGEPSLYINAASALSQLASLSLHEDKYGNVQRDVASVIRTLTAVTRKLDAFTARLQPHWTDVSGSRTCPEVEELLAVLKESLGLLIGEFEPYAKDLRLGLADVRLAKEAAATATATAAQMQQVR